MTKKLKTVQKDGCLFYPLFRYSLSNIPQVDTAEKQASGFKWSQLCEQINGWYFSIFPPLFPPARTFFPLLLNMDL